MRDQINDEKPVENDIIVDIHLRPIDRSLDHIFTVVLTYILIAALIISLP